MNKLNDKLVTVIITTYNRKDLLERALISVIKQTYKNIEIIVSDDCSNYDVKSYLKEISIKFDRDIIYRCNKVNSGACYTRNEAIKISNGFFITGLDDDDEFTTDRVECLVSNYNPIFSFVCSNTLVISKKGSYRLFNAFNNKIISFHDFMWGNNVGTQVLVEKSRLKELNGFDETLTSAQDSDMWARLLLKYGPALRVNKLTYILHTEHDTARITTSNNKLNGMKRYSNKYRSKRTDSQNRLSDFVISLWENNNKLNLKSIKLLNIHLLYIIFLRKLKLN